MKTKFDVEWMKSHFPACKREKNGLPVVYLDGPGGTQVPRVVSEKMADYLFNHNANERGNFDASLETTRLNEYAEHAMADFLGCDPRELAFGYSSSQNNFNLSLALARTMKSGDEILITDMDHRCNREPWLALAERGIIVKSVAINREDFRLDMDDFKKKLSKKTKVCAFNWASNALGTVSDVKTLCEAAHEAGAVTVVDAVHYAAHHPIDLREIGTDVLVCSAYKFFGPHLGIIYIKESLLDALEFYNVRSPDLLAGNRKLHMGTPNFEAICGTAAAVDFIASVGEKCAGTSGRRQGILAALDAFEQHEAPLARKLRDALRGMPGVTMYGPPEGTPRTSTVIFTMEGKLPEDVCRVLGEKAVCSWYGDFYANVIVNDVLGLKEKGGVVRLGLAPYNTEEDIDRTIELIENIARGRLLV